MATNISHTVGITSGALPISGSVRALHITNTGTNPVTIRLAEDGAAVFGAGIILPSQYSSFSFESGTMQLGNSSAIALGGPSTIAIFYA